MATTRRWVALGATALLVLAGLLVATPTPGVPGRPAAGATAEPREHARVRQGPSGPELVWRSPARLPVTDGRPEFRVGTRLLGYPRLGRDGRTLRLPTAGLGRVRHDRVQVWLGARRLDARTGTLPGRSPVARPETGTAPAADPGRTGPYDVRSFDYSARDLPWWQFRQPMEVLGHAVLPVGVPDAPLVLFLHGRHNYCYGPGDTGRWPCTGRSRPVPSYLGYEYLQRTLASQGYATVSISANAVNAQDGDTPDGGARARSVLVQHHLDLLARWSADATNRRWGGRLDLGHVVLVGHSRGGEGVDQAAIDSGAGSPPYHLDGQVLLAPTDFGWQTAPYLPTEVLLPYCDGDVSDLQGQRYVDAAQTETDDDPTLRSSVLLRGANHNYFNTEWTRGISAAPSFDDWFDRTDPVCGKASPTRLTAAEQRRAARTFVAAGVHAFLGDDTSAALRWLDSGHPVAVRAAGPALAWTHALGGRRETVRLDHGAAPAGAGVACRAGLPYGDFGAGRPVPVCGTREFYRQPHWTPSAATPASVHAAYAAGGLPRDLSFAWTRKGARGGFALDRPLDLSTEHTTLDLRAVVRPGSGPAGLQVVLGSGDREWAGPVRTLAPFPGRPWLAALVARTVRVDPADYAGHLDLARVDRVELRSVSARGHVWVLDASRRQRGLDPVPDRSLPAIRLGRVTQPEGDAATGGVAQVPFRVLGEITAPATFAIAADQWTFDWTEPAQLTVVTVRPGQTRGTVGVRYEADDRQDLPRQRQLVFAAAVHGAVTSGFTGAATIRDDDPAPKVTFEPVRRTVSYGEPLVYRLALSAPVDYYPANRLRAVRDDRFRPVRTSDVPRSWLRAQLGRVPLDVPLWQVWKHGFIDLPPGRTRALVEVPTLHDPLHPGPKALTLRLTSRHLTPPLQATVRVR